MRARRVRPAWWLVAGAALAVLVVAGFALVAGTGPYRAVGNADPGTVIRLGTPLLRLIVDVAAVGCIGSLAFLTFLTRPQQSGTVSAAGYGQLRIAARAALVWFAGALLLVPFSAGDVAGNRLADTLVPEHMLAALGAMEQPRAWLLTTAAALVLALGCRYALRWQTGVALLSISLLAVLPPLVTAHGSADTGHDLAIAALLIHVPAAAVWVGVLLALLLYARHHGTVDTVMAARYSRLATSCLLVLVASGLVPAMVLVTRQELFGSGYGIALLVKIGLTAALGTGGVLLRGRALRLLTEARVRWRAISRLLAAELIVLFGVLSVSVGLTHLAVPDFLGRVLGTQDTMLGYQLTGPPTVLRLLTDWRIDLVFGPLAILLAAGYLAGVVRLRRLGQAWPAGRTAAWLGGCLVLLLATSSGLGRYASAMFSVHIASHMLVSMLVPVLLALGGPLSLARAATRPEEPPALPGSRDWLAVLRDSRLMRILTQPAVALTLFAGSPFALYLTGLFDALARFHWGHIAINAWFLVVGYLFAWPVLGVDRAPRPLPNLARLGMLLAAMPADIVFGAVIIGIDRVIGNGPASSNMYQALALPWVPDLFADQRLAGILALVIGEAVLFVMMAALLARWNRLDDFTTHAHPANYRNLKPVEVDN